MTIEAQRVELTLQIPKHKSGDGLTFMYSVEPTQVVYAQITRDGEVLAIVEIVYDTFVELVNTFLNGTRLQ